jgi:hypothetical protein
LSLAAIGLAWHRRQRFSTISTAACWSPPYRPGNLMVVKTLDNPKRAVAPANFLDWRRDHLIQSWQRSTTSPRR